MVDGEERAFVKSCLGFYDRLSEKEISAIEGAVSRGSYPKGAVLRDKSTECLGVLLVRTGELRVYLLSEDGREVTLYRLGPGDPCVLSASCILYSMTFEVHIEADRESVVYKIGIGVFEKLMKNNVYVENFAYKNAMERFSDVMWAMERILFTRFDKRLAGFLLDESIKSNSPEIRLTHEQIAKYLGSAREVVSRTLKTFQAKGILEQSRISIRILDKAKLKLML